MLQNQIFPDFTISEVGINIFGVDKAEVYYLRVFASEYSFNRYLQKAISGLSPKPIGDIRRCVYDVFENFFLVFTLKWQLRSSYIGKETEQRKYLMNHPGHVAHFIIKNTLLIKVCVYVTLSSFWRPDKCSRWGGGGQEPLLFFCFSVLSHIQALLSLFFRHILQKRCRCHVQLSIISQTHKGLQRLSKLLKWAHDFNQR